MIKKIFIGVLLAGVFGLLVLGAVNRTLAKSTDREPLALSENETERYGGGNGSQGQYQASNDNPDDCLPENHTYESRLGGRQGQGQGSLNPSADGNLLPKGNSEGRSISGQGGQPEGAPADGLGTGLADVEEIITDSGTVVSTTDELWVVNLEDFGTLEIEGRALSYLQENGFSVSVNDTVVITGFMEGDDLEVSRIQNQTTGTEIAIREATGQPLWAGGRGGGGN